MADLTDPDSLGSSLLALSREDTAQIERRSAAPALEVLETYVGVYELTPTSSITVSMINGLLMSQAKGQGVVELDPVSADAFISRKGEGRITFARGASGGGAGLILYRDGQDKIARIT